MTFNSLYYCNKHYYFAGLPIALLIIKYVTGLLKNMRFNDLEIPKCSYWLEKLNVLFLVDKESKNVPFISSSIASIEEQQMKKPYSFNQLLSKIYPDDQIVFKNMISKMHETNNNVGFRLLDLENDTVPFKINSINIGSKNKSRFLIAISLDK